MVQGDSFRMPTIHKSIKNIKVKPSLFQGESYLTLTLWGSVQNDRSEGEAVTLDKFSEEIETFSRIRRAHGYSHWAPDLMGSGNIFDLFDQTHLK